MFSNLMASAPKRHAVSPSAWGTATILHALVVLGVLWGTSRATSIPPGERVIYAELSDWKEVAPPEIVQPPPPKPAPEPAAAQVAGPDLPAGFQELRSPEQILAEIPPPGAIAIRAADFSGRGIAGGVAGGRALALQPAAPEAEPAPVSVAVVDRPPRVLNGDELTRAMEALYPQTYRSAGIEGEVVVQLVVDTKGEVERDGITILSSTHPAFAEATRALITRLRFEPASRNGRAVRVWVRLPVTWKIR